MTDDRKLLASDLRESLSYDSDTGIFVWRKRHSNAALPGKVAGTLNGDGYIQIRVNKVIYKAHRLAWLYVHGVWPLGQIDHINGSRTDNRILNLRSVSSQENTHNQRLPQRHNTSGYLGVSRRSDGKFQAEIRVNRVRFHIGTFATPEEASEAYFRAKREMHKGAVL